MAGYSGFSMSNNAVSAYEAGLLPASKIGRGIPAKLVEQYCRYEEWHHSSKNYNKTRFYNPDYVLATFGVIEHDDYARNDHAVAALAAHKQEKSSPTIEKRENCTVTWIEWSGSLKRPKATEMVAHGCLVEVKGATATVIFPSGTSMTKRLTTRGFSFTENRAEMAQAKEAEGKQEIASPSDSRELGSQARNQVRMQERPAVRADESGSLEEPAQLKGDGRGASNMRPGQNIVNSKMAAARAEQAERARKESEAAKEMAKGLHVVGNAVVFDFASYTWSRTADGSIRIDTGLNEAARKAGLSGQAVGAFYSLAQKMVAETERAGFGDMVRAANEMGVQVDPAKVAFVTEKSTTPPNQKYVGSVVGVDRELGLVYQELGRGTGTVHLMDSLSRTPTVGENISVSYKDGLGLVAGRQASRSQTR